LFSDTNKAQGINENANPQPIDPYESTLSDDEIRKLVSQWIRTYSVYYKEIKTGQDISFDYWVGKHRTDNRTNTGDDSQVVDNLTFEAIETFLPIATRANPEALVQADVSEQAQELARDIKIALTNWADTQKFRRKLAKMTRGWLLNRMGALKLAWNPITKTIDCSVVNTKKMVFDKDGYVDEAGIFRGDYEGEKKLATADKLIEMFPKKSKEIMEKAMNKEGTKLEYYEWWYRGTDILFTLEDVILGKFKNPHWNWDITGVEPTEEIKDEETQVVLREASAGQEAQEGINHLKERTSPYRYLCIFNTGEQPHDNTSLILQNVSQQDLINRRERQIEENVKRMNNGLVVSGTSFTEEQASQAASALGRGVAIRVPNGDVSKAVLRLPTPNLPSDVFNSLKDARQELRNIFGTAGSTADSIKSEETVRGKVKVSQMDSSRIGGGITEYIEQVADSIYNLVVQFMFVHYEDEHFITSAGEISGMRLIALKNQRFIGLKTLDITVKEGTLIPKDPLTQRNEAIDLWSANAIDPRTLFKKLDFPNPDEATNQLILWQMFQKGQIQPQMYLPTFQVGGQATQMQPNAQNGQPVQGNEGNAVNPVGQEQPQPAPVPTSPEAVQAESNQLLRSAPQG